MRILVVQANKAEGDSTVRMLNPGRHKAEQASDYASAMGLLGTGSFECILIDWSLPNHGASSILKRLVAMNLTPSPNVIVIFEKNPGGDMGSVFAEGANDFIRKPFWKEELAARIEAPMRGRPPIAPTSADVSASDAEPFVFSQWTDLGTPVVRDLVGMAGVEFEALAPAVELPRLAYAARLPLVLASRSLEIRVNVGVRDSCIKSLSGCILGEPAPSPETIDDLLREIANNSAGAIKKAAPEPEKVTIGLPESIGPQDFLETLQRSFWRFRCRVRGKNTELIYAVEKVSTAKRIVAASALREGMVLVGDLRNDLGLLLISRGTRLTRNAAERIARMIGENRRIEVAAAA